MKTKSRNLLISFLLMIAMLLGVFAITPLTAFAVSGTPTPEETPAEMVYVGGVALGVGQYVTNGSNTAVTGEPNVESGYAYYLSGGTLILSDYEYEGTGYTHDTSEKSVVYSDGKLDVILFGKNTVTNTADATIWSANGIRTEGNLTFNGPGAITINAPYAICGDALVRIDYGKIVIPDSTIAIEAGGNFVLVRGVLQLNSTQPILSYADFISGGSFTATAEQGVFKTAPTLTNMDDYNMYVSYNVDGSVQEAYVPENITQYKYFRLTPPAKTEINSISVSDVVIPEVGDAIGAFDCSGATYGGNYYEDGWSVEAFVGEEWQIIEDDTTVVEAGVQYRAILWIEPNEGYTFPLDITGDVLLNGQAATVHKIYEYPDYNSVGIAYEFSYTATATPITSISVSGADLPEVGETAGDMAFTPDSLTYGGEYIMVGRGMQKFDGTEWVNYVGEGDVVEVGVRYRISIVLAPKLGYDFTSVDSVTVNGKAGVLEALIPTGSVNYAAICFEFSYEAAPATPITSISVSGADLPEVGETADDMAFTPESLTYVGEYKMVGRGFQKFTGTEWVDYNSEGDIIEYGVKYRVSLVLAPNEGYAFADTITSDDVTFNSKAAAFDTLIAGVGYAAIYYEFSYEAPVTDYGITIADKDESGATVGVLITEENCTDVLGDGTVSYDPTTNTLTLNGYKYEGSGFDYGSSKFGIYVPESTGTLNIVLKGENVIDVTKTDTLARIRISSIGVYTWETDVVFSGDGSLVISATDGGLFIIGEDAQSLEIKGGNITVNACYSIDAKFFKMSGGSLTVNATEVDGDIASAIYSYEFKMTGGNLKITSDGLGVEMWHDSDEDAPPMISGGTFEISVAIAGGAFCYYNYDEDVCVAIAPDLTNYVGAYKMTAGANADGTSATDYSASDIATYKYAKLESVHVHDYGTAWESDANEHWNECECRDKANTAPHADENNDGKCDICDYAMGNADNPGGDKEPEKTGLSGGAIAGIAVGSVAVAGVGGFSLFWFVIKKKKFADLIALFKKK